MKNIEKNKYQTLLYILDIIIYPDIIKKKL